MQAKIGTPLWYVPSVLDLSGAETEHPMKQFDKGQSFAAVVAFVADEHRVNLAVVDHRGFTHWREGVELLQAGDDAPPNGVGYAMFTA